MKKIINLLCFLLILNFLILGRLIIKNYKNKNLLSIVYAKSFNHSNVNYNLIYKILKDANKDNLIKYIDYLELNVIDNIPNDKNNNIAFTLSSPDKSSFIALYKKTNNNNFKFEYIIDKLSTINSFYFYKDFLIVEQTNSTSSTNFTENEYIEIFHKNNNIYTSVFKKNIYNEKFINIDNIDFKEIENSSIDCLNGDVAKLLCITTLTKYKSISDRDEFEEIDKTIKKEVFEWNDSDKQFIKSELNDIK